MSTYLAHRLGAAPPGEFMFVDWPPFTAAPNDREHRPACAGNERMVTTDAAEARDLALEFCTACPVFDACNDEAVTMAADRTWCQSPEGVWAGRLWIGGKPAKSKKPRAYNTPITCGHPQRPHHAQGMCQPCYRRNQSYFRSKGQCRNCGEEKVIYAKGRCGACYMRIHRAAS